MIGTSCGVSNYKGQVKVTYVVKDGHLEALFRAIREILPGREITLSANAAGNIRKPFESSKVQVSNDSDSDDEEEHPVDYLSHQKETNNELTNEQLLDQEYNTGCSAAPKFRFSVSNKGTSLYESYFFGPFDTKDATTSFIKKVSNHGTQYQAYRDEDDSKYYVCHTPRNEKKRGSSAANTAEKRAAHGDTTALDFLEKCAKSYGSDFEKHVRDRSIVAGTGDVFSQFLLQIRSGQEARIEKVNLESFDEKSTRGNRS